MLYKLLGSNRESFHGGNAVWTEPYCKVKRPVAFSRMFTPSEYGWMPHIYDIRMCQKGYHLIEGLDDIVTYLAPTLYQAEQKGHTIKCGNVILAPAARLTRLVGEMNNTEAVQLAIDCVEYRVSHDTEDYSRAQPFIGYLRMGIENKNLHDSFAVAAGLILSSYWWYVDLLNLVDMIFIPSVYGETSFLDRQKHLFRCVRSIMCKCLRDARMFYGVDSNNICHHCETLGDRSVSVEELWQLHNAEEMWQLHRYLNYLGVAYDTITVEV